MSYEQLQDVRISMHGLSGGLACWKYSNQSRFHLVLQFAFLLRTGGRGPRVLYRYERHRSRVQDTNGGLAASAAVPLRSASSQGAALSVGCSSVLPQSLCFERRVVAPRSSYKLRGSTQCAGTLTP